MGDGDFSEFQRLYAYQFEEHGKRLSNAEAALMKHATDLTMLKVKSGMFGAAMGGGVVLLEIVVKAVL